MGKNIGFEQDGKTEFLRPVLVIKKMGSLYFTVALTTQGKEGSFLHYVFQTARFNERNQKNRDESCVILSQVKVMDKKRFTEKMGTVGQKEFQVIKQKLKTVLL
jgi:mRNA-degrading endonuclease toxin of MazEF toxin-antitoxin module